jgi:predicted nucleic acid-binding protein
MALTVLDAGVVIAMLDATDAHHPASRAALREALDRGDDLVLPASAYAECLVGPLRRGPDAAAIVDAFLEALPARVEPVTRSIARVAAALRARHGRAVRLPDALVLATAVELHAHLLLTTDAGWPALDVPVQVVGFDSA